MGHHLVFDEVVDAVACLTPDVARLEFVASSHVSFLDLRKQLRLEELLVNRDRSKTLVDTGIDIVVVFITVVFFHENLCNEAASLLTNLSSRLTNELDILVLTWEDILKIVVDLRSDDGESVVLI